MLKLHNKTKAILSSSSFSITAFIAFFTLAMAHAGQSVKVPLETFAYKRKAAPTLDGTLLLAKKKTNAATGKAVLLVRHASRSKLDDPGFAQKLSESGFDVLSITLRNKANEGQALRTIIEDVQSGVVFLRTDKRVQAPKVVIMGSGIGASGAVHYASASKQMGVILGGLVLVHPIADHKNITFFEPLEKVIGIPVLLAGPKASKTTVEAVTQGKTHCQTFCRELIYDNGAQGIDFQKAIIEFLLRPNA